MACTPAQSWPAVLHPIDWGPPGSFVHRNLQARTLEWVAILFSRGFSPPRDQTSVSCVSCIGRRILLPPSHLGSPLSHHDRVTIRVCLFIHKNSDRPDQRFHEMMLAHSDVCFSNLAVVCAHAACDPTLHIYRGQNPPLGILSSTCFARPPLCPLPFEQGKSNIESNVNTQQKL